MVFFGDVRWDICDLKEDLFLLGDSERIITSPNDEEQRI